MVPRAKVFYKSSSFCDRIKQRTRNIRQNKRLEDYPETKKVADKRKTLVSLEKRKEFAKASGKVKFGAAIHATTTLLGRIRTKFPTKDPWPRISSSKSRKRR